MKTVIKGIVVVLLIFGGTIIVIDSGYVYTPKWYQETNHYQKRSLRAALQGIAAFYERSYLLPPHDSKEAVNVRPDKWGTPIQYSYENSVPTIRAAGRDKILNTKDDLTQIVNIKEE